MLLRLVLPILLLLPTLSYGQLTLRLTSWPANTPDASAFFVAGNFNNWDPGHEDYQLQPEGDVFVLTLDLAAGSYEYKFTRGSWQSVEGTASGTFRPNRTLTYDGQPQTIDLTIAGWEDIGNGNGSLSPNVSILAEDFTIPQLNRQRRIWLYLPPDYATTDRSYPVLYMHDGQNLFDPGTSFAGEWEVDETLDALFSEGDPGIIVVGIDNGGSHRLAEYTPWPNPQYGGGEGDAYVDFLTETLKPYIDANYRTLPEAEHTGIMGSSLGGLISLYGALREPEVFGKVGVFSPSLWFTDDIYEMAEATDLNTANLRLYLLAGEQEDGGSVVDDVAEMVTTLTNSGQPADELTFASHPDGQHAEWYWAREFGAAYTWLFGGPTTSSQTPLEWTRITVAPNPGSDTLRLLSANGLMDALYQIVDAQGKVWQTGRYQGEPLLLDRLPTGWFQLLLWPLEGNAQRAAFLIQR